MSGFRFRLYSTEMDELGELSRRLYRVAMSYNKGLDRDKDAIACERL